MGRSRQKVDEVVRDYLTVFDGDDPVTGLTFSDFEIFLSVDGVDSLVVVNIFEIGDGRYEVSFTPDVTGAWYLHMKASGYAERGWQETFDVVTSDVDADAVDEIAEAVGALEKDGLTLLEHQGVQSSMLAGEASGGPDDIEYMAVDGSEVRVAYVDADDDGNRPDVTITP